MLAVCTWCLLCIDISISISIQEQDCCFRLQASGFRLQASGDLFLFLFLGADLVAHLRSECRQDCAAPPHAAREEEQDAAGVAHGRGDCVGTTTKRGGEQ